MSSSSAISLPGTGFDEGLKAKETAVMTRGSLDGCAREYGTGLTPLQFAAQVGHHAQRARVGRVVDVAQRDAPAHLAAYSR